MASNKTKKNQQILIFEMRNFRESFLKYFLNNLVIINTAAD